MVLETVENFVFFQRQVLKLVKQLLPPITGSEDRQTLDNILEKFRADMMTQLTALRDSS